MIEFKLPSLGADMDEGTLLEWKVKPGDAVKKGQIVAIVDTTKAAVDVESWQEGTVAELIIMPGNKIPVGTVLATFLDPGEAPRRRAARTDGGHSSSPIPRTSDSRRRCFAHVAPHGIPGGARACARIRHRHRCRRWHRPARCGQA